MSIRSNDASLQSTNKLYTKEFYSLDFTSNLIITKNIKSEDPVVDTASVVRSYIEALISKAKQDMRENAVGSAVYTNAKAKLISIANNTFFISASDLLSHSVTIKDFEGKSLNSGVVASLNSIDNITINDFITKFTNIKNSNYYVNDTSNRLRTPLNDTLNTIANLRSNIAAEVQAIETSKTSSTSPTTPTTSTSAVYTPQDDKYTNLLNNLRNVSQMQLTDTSTVPYVSSAGSTSDVSLNIFLNGGQSGSYTFLGRKRDVAAIQNPTDRAQAEQYLRIIEAQVPNLAASSPASPAATPAAPKQPAKPLSFFVETGAITTTRPQDNISVAAPGYFVLGVKYSKPTFNISGYGGAGVYAITSVNAKDVVDANGVAVAAGAETANSKESRYSATAFALNTGFSFALPEANNFSFSYDRVRPLKLTNREVDVNTSPNVLNTVNPADYTGYTLDNVNLKVNLNQNTKTPVVFGSSFSKFRAETLKNGIITNRFNSTPAEVNIFTKTKQLKLDSSTKAQGRFNIGVQYETGKFAGQPFKNNDITQAHLGENDFSIKEYRAYARYYRKYTFSSETSSGGSFSLTLEPGAGVFAERFNFYSPEKNGNQFAIDPTDNDYKTYLSSKVNSIRPVLASSGVVTYKTSKFSVSLSANSLWVIPAFRSRQTYDTTGAITSRFTPVPTTPISITGAKFTFTRLF